LLRHIVMFRFKADTPEQDRQAAAEKLSGLRRTIPEIRRLTVARDRGGSANNLDLVLEADFDTEADFMQYVQNDTHQRVWKDAVEPITDELASLQYEIEVP
jgi:hypothetical protein